MTDWYRVEFYISPLHAEIDFERAEDAALAFVEALESGDMLIDSQRITLAGPAHG